MSVQSQSNVFKLSENRSLMFNLGYRHNELNVLEEPAIKHPKIHVFYKDFVVSVVLKDVWLIDRASHNLDSTDQHKLNVGTSKLIFFIIISSIFERKLQ